MKHNKGFTLIELLVVVAIIGILAAIIISSLSNARLRAKDAAVVTTMHNFQVDVELETDGNYQGVCISDSYTSFADYVTTQGGEPSCTEGGGNYSLFVTLPSELALAPGIAITPAYAQTISADSYCVNSFGSKKYASSTVRDQLTSYLDGRSETNVFCSVSEAEKILKIEIPIEDIGDVEGGGEPSETGWSYVCEGGVAVCYNNGKKVESSACELKGGLEPPTCDGGENAYSWTCSGGNPVCLDSKGDQTDPGFCEKEDGTPPSCEPQPYWKCNLERVPECFTPEGQQTDPGLCYDKVGSAPSC